jgi:hypothetical protein
MLIGSEMINVELNSPEIAVSLGTRNITKGGTQNPRTLAANQMRRNYQGILDSKDITHLFLLCANFF